MADLKEQVMVNQFVMVSGCNRQDAIQYLVEAQWQFEVALSMYFNESPVVEDSLCPTCGTSHSQTMYNKTCVPANTPSTPPQFIDTLKDFAKLSSTDTYSSSPLCPS